MLEFLYECFVVVEIPRNDSEVIKQEVICCFIYFIVKKHSFQDQVY